MILDRFARTTRGDCEETTRKDRLHRLRYCRWEAFAMMPPRMKAGFTSGFLDASPGHTDRDHRIGLAGSRSDDTSSHEGGLLERHSGEALGRRDCHHRIAPVDDRFHEGLARGTQGRCSTHRSLSSHPIPAMITGHGSVVFERPPDGRSCGIEVMR